MAGLQWTLDLSKNVCSQEPSYYFLNRAIYAAGLILLPLPATQLKFALVLFEMCLINPTGYQTLKRLLSVI